MEEGLQIGPARKVLEGQWRAGQSGNAKGAGLKIENLGTMIRRTTAEGAEIVTFLVAILRGDLQAGARDRLEAAKVLLDRGFGKAPDVVVHADASTEGVRALLEAGDVSVESLARALAPQLAASSVVAGSVAGSAEPDPVAIEEGADE